jgi:uncharacterized membrane protein (DUF2068 family)
MTHQKSWVLSWIVAFKVVKVVALLTAGALLLRYAHRDPVSVLVDLATAVHVPLTSRLFAQALEVAMSLTPGRQIAVASTAFGYAGLLATEAVGLTLRRGWARWFTIAITASFLPIEILEIARRPGSLLRILTFVVNIAIVIFLYRRKEDFE